MANGHGGARQGSGRKPLAATVARRALVAERIDDADRAFAYLVFWMDDEEAGNEFRRVCALDVLDRVHGKPQNKVEHSGGIEVHDWRAGKTPDEVAAVEEAARIVNER